MIKQLTIEYHDQCCEMLASSKKVSGQLVGPNNNHERMLKHFSRYLTDNERYHVMGYFEGSQLVAYMVQGFYTNKDIGRFWLAILLVSNIKTNYFTFAEPYMKQMFTRAFEIAESRECYQYFYSVSDKISRVYETQWYKNNPNGYDGVYDLIDAAVIPPNTKPTYKLYWKLMGEKTRSYTVHIKMRKRKHAPCNT